MGLRSDRRAGVPVCDHGGHRQGRARHRPVVGKQHPVPVPCASLAAQRVIDMTDGTQGPVLDNETTERFFFNRPERDPRGGVLRPLFLAACRDKPSAANPQLQTHWPRPGAEIIPTPALAPVALPHIRRWITPSWREGRGCRPEAVPASGPRALPRRVCLLRSRRP